MPSLADAYIAEDPALRDFFAKPFRTLFDAPPEIHPWDPAVLEAVQRLNGSLECPPLAGNEAIIITGQQPGLFTGPLYTVYKAVSVVLLARAVTQRTGVPCAPMFWIGADDHDFEEVCTAHILTRNHESLALHYEPDQLVDGLPLFRVPLSPGLHALIEDAANQAPGSEHRGEVAAFLHASLDASSTLAEWFARIMARLFRDTPLRFFAPYLPDAQAAAARVIEREIREPLITTRLVNDAGQRLEALGYAAQVVKGDTDCAFFLEHEGRRRKVVFERGRFHLPEEHLFCSQEEMLSLLHASPERFSPNVALRCVVRQALLPVAAYVAGPGEIAYWAQTRGLFEHFGYPMPIVYPRTRAVVTATKLKKLLARFSFSLDDLALSEDLLVERALRQTARHPALDAIERRRASVQAEMQALLEEMDALKLKSEAPLDMARNASEQIASVLERLERGMLRSDEAQTEAVRKQVRRLCTALAPGRKPQERHYSVLSFLFEQGWEFVPRLLRLLDPESFILQEVEL